MPRSCPSLPRCSRGWLCSLGNRGYATTPRPAREGTPLRKQTGRVHSKGMPIERRIEAALGAFLLVPLVSPGAGYLLGGGVLHPARHPLTPELIGEADRILASAGATREDF